MYTKKCPYCGSSSYSASARGAWKCPGCGKNLSLLPAEPAGASDSGAGCLKRNAAATIRREKTKESEQPAAGENVFYLKVRKPRAKR